MGEFIPLIEAQTSLSHTLAETLHVPSHCASNWVALQLDQSSVVVGCSEQDFTDCTISQNGHLLRFPQDGFVLPVSQTQSNLLCILHGDFESRQFLDLLSVVKTKFSATHRIVLRMQAAAHSLDMVSLGGFSVSLDIKNTEYAVTPATTQSQGDEWESGLNFQRLMERFPLQKDSLLHLKKNLKHNREKLKAWEIGDVSIQFALHCLSSDQVLHQVKQVSENLPTYVRRLTDIRVTEAMQVLVNKNFKRQSSALFLNAVPLDPSSTIPHLMQQIKEEVDFQARALSVSPVALSSWFKSGGSSSSWGDRLDVRKFAKGAIHFLNDIEKDSMYRSMPTSFSKQFQQAQQQQQQQLIPVRRNLYTVILVVDPMVLRESGEDWLGVVSYFLRMGAPIRFGLVLADHKSCVNAISRLFLAAKREYGVEPALAFLSQVTSCSNALDAFTSALKESTGSWTGSKFTVLGQNALDGKIAEVELSVEKQERYVRELNLSPNMVVFNGRVLDVEKGARLDRLLQTALFQEQALFTNHAEEFNEKEDILAQLLAFSHAKPKLSRFRDQHTYLSRPPPTVHSHRITVWSSLVDTVEEDGDVHWLPLDALQESVPANTVAVVNGRIITNTEPLTKQEAVELIEEERARLAKVPELANAAAYLECSFLFAQAEKRLAGHDSEVPVLSKDDPFVFVDDNNDESVRKDQEMVLTFRVNPLDVQTPKLAAMAVWLKEFLPHARVQILFVPEPDVSALPPSSFHRWSGANGFVEYESDVVPQHELLTLKLSGDASWIVFPQELGQQDPDNLLLSNKDLVARYYVAHVLIAGHCHDVGTGEPAAGMQVELVKETGLQSSDHSVVVVADSLVMYNLGYWQVKARPGFYSVRPKADKSNKFTFTDMAVSYVSLTGPGAVALKATSAAANPLVMFNDKDGDDDTMHVFSLASGALYERFLRIMMLSVRKRSTGKICFWLLENYMSSDMKRFLPGFAKRNNFTYELVTYKWPEWLRGQSELQRQIWGMKILFLDVLFPLHIKRVIYVDADQVLRADLRELWTLNLQGAPYAMTPFCDSRKETLGFQFWRSGYWAQHLRGKNYHISALFVVDLDLFRKDSVGDRLRAVYQQLSADPNSLSNLDQDLPNFAQHDIRIFSLPQEWLWCESWCSDESLGKAKTIDLCNNPLRKESKLDMARRVIQGASFQESWEELDREVGWTELQG